MSNFNRPIHTYAFALADRFRQGGVRVIFCFIALFFAATIAFGDTVHLRSGDSSVRGVTIVSFKQAQLELLDRGGKRRTVDYGDIALIRVDGRPDLNRAEQLFLTQRFSDAISAYQTCLTRNIRRGSWLETWIRVRLLNLLAGQGRIEEAADLYVELARQIPDWLVGVAPTENQIKASPDQLERAARRIIQARDELTDPKSREALGKFYQHLGRQCKPLPPARSVLPKGLDEKDLEKYDQPGPWLDLWAEEKLKNNQPEPVLRVIDRLFRSSLRRNLPGVFYWRGRAQLVCRDFDFAALSFLRVAVEFPSSSYAPSSLFYAGKAASLAGRSSYAKKLWREVIDTYGNSNDYQVIQLVEQARDSLQDKE